MYYPCLPSLTLIFYIQPHDFLPSNNFNFYYGAENSMVRCLKPILANVHMKAASVIKFLWNIAIDLQEKDFKIGLDFCMLIFMLCCTLHKENKKCVSINSSKILGWGCDQ